MPVDLKIADYVRQLRRAGMRPGERLVQHILAAGEHAREPLLELALDTDLLHADEPECFAPIHALRLLGELHTPSIIAPLLGKYPLELEYEEEELPQTWATETPQIIGNLGAAAVAPLWAIVDDEARVPSARGAALTALAYASERDPALRDEVVAGMRMRLEQSGDPIFNGQLVSGLANLGVAEVYGQVMRMYREGRIDQQVIPAGTARQLLLSKSEKRLACVHHPLWERYDQHGPFPPEAREA